MLPDNSLSAKARLSGFAYPVKGPGDALVDWEFAGVYLNDPSQGLLVKLWRLDAKPNADTGLVDVVVSAPGGVAVGEASRVLFSGANIGEVSLAFDQNMNPCVAYMQGSDSKIYWHDPTIPGMTHTTLPAGSRNPRCTLDDKRAFNVAASDIIVSYIRAGSLYHRRQRDRYATEYLLKSGVGSNVELVGMAMNTGSRIQFRLRNHALTPDSGAIVQVAPYLADIVQDLCSKSGIARENIDVSDLWRETDIVPGLKVATETGLDKPIEWLAEMYLFDKSQHGRKLRFEHRGKPVTFRIPYADLVTNGNKEVLQQDRADGKKLPREVSIKHIDPDAGFASNKQTATRRSNLIVTDEKVKIDSQVVTTADHTASIALAVLKARWGEQYTYKLSTTLRYTEITVGDVGEVQDAQGDWHRIRMLEKNEDDGVIDWEATMDAGPTVYGETSMPGNALPPPTSTTPGLVGNTVLEVLNLSPQRDQDDELCLYIAARGNSSGWDGYALLVSYDDGVSYAEAYRARMPSNIGETATSISASGASVEVLTPYALSSVTEAAIAAGQNRAVIGAEEVQYQTVTLLGMSGGMYHYNLSGIVRKVLGTAAAVWPAGTRFVQFDQSVIYAQVQRAYYDTNIKIKAVSIGQSPDEVAGVVIHTAPMRSQTEWAAKNVVADNISGGGLSVTWDANPRLGVFGSAPFHSKYFTGYRVKFSDDHTIDTTATSVTYASGVHGSIVEVYGLNAITGEGDVALGYSVLGPSDPDIYADGVLPPEAMYDDATGTDQLEEG